MDSLAIQDPARPGWTFVSECLKKASCRSALLSGDFLGRSTTVTWFWYGEILMDQLGRPRTGGPEAG